MKRFGFHANQLYFNMREPSKVKYVYHPKYGNFEAPKVKDTTDVKVLHHNY